MVGQYNNMKLLIKKKLKSPVPWRGEMAEHPLFVVSLGPPQPPPPHPRRILHSPAPQLLGGQWHLLVESMFASGPTTHWPPWTNIGSHLAGSSKTTEPDSEREMGAYKQGSQEESISGYPFFLAHELNRCTDAGHFYILAKVCTPPPPNSKFAQCKTMTGVYSCMLNQKSINVPYLKGWVGPPLSLLEAAIHGTVIIIQQLGQLLQPRKHSCIRSLSVRMQHTQALFASPYFLSSTKQVSV